MEFKAYSDLDGHANIVVDGSPHKDSVLVLSHWKGSGTPEAHIRDTSAEIVLDYIEKNELPAEAKFVSNDHYDEDGLIGVFSVLNRDYALAHKKELIDIAEAGDFRKFNNYKSAKVIFSLSKLLEKESQFIPEYFFSKPYPEMAAEFYRRALEVLPDVIENIDRYEEYWSGEFEFLTKSEDLIKRGDVSITEMPEHDLAVVTVPENEVIHDMAIYNQTHKTQIVTRRGQDYAFMYRYETWVQYKSFPYPLRVNLSPLAEKLTALETNGNVWEYQGSQKITPYLLSNKASSLNFDHFYSLLCDALNTSEIDWDPAV